MYRAKESGGARFEVFDDVIASCPGRAATSSASLREALDARELRVHYQPRVSFNDETGLAGFEALVRWEHPELGLMAPIEFMSIAEETGLIVPIGEWVIEQALDQVERWRESRPGVTISVNLSARQLSDSHLVEHVVRHDPRRRPRSRRAVPGDHRGGAGGDAGARHAPARGAQRARDHARHRRLRHRATRRSITLSELPVHILKIDTTLVSRLGRERGRLRDPVSDVVRAGPRARAQGGRRGRRDRRPAGPAAAAGVRRRPGLSVQPADARGGRLQPARYGCGTAPDAYGGQARSTNPVPRKVRMSGGSPSLRRRRVT